MQKRMVGTRVSGDHARTIPIVESNDELYGQGRQHSEQWRYRLLEVEV